MLSGKVRPVGPTGPTVSECFDFSSDRSARPVGQKQRLHGKSRALKKLPDRCRRVGWNPLKTSRPVGPTGSADRFGRPVQQVHFLRFLTRLVSLQFDRSNSFPTGPSDRSVLVLIACDACILQVCSSCFFFYSFVLLQSNICSSSSNSSKPLALQCNVSLGNCIIFPFA